MRYFRILLLLISVCAGVALAAVPVEQLGTDREKAVISSQHRAGQAYRDWEEARYQRKLAEQDVMNAEEAHRQANSDKAERKRELDAALKARAAARMKEEAARKAYDKAVLDVDRARR